MNPTPGLSEFEFIDRLIKAHCAQGQPFYAHPQALGIGDDAALLPALDPGYQHVVATDMLIEGRHYFPDVAPDALGHKVLAVNLSDLAAMGAEPVAFTLAAGIKRIDVPWMEAFFKGLLALARLHQCALIGGDTTRTAPDAPDVFSVTVIGRVPIGAALCRHGLREGDELWVSGDLGDGSFCVRERRSSKKLLWPEPRLALGLALRGIAHSAIDISDGLLSEVNHLLKNSSARAQEGQSFCAHLNWSSLPLGHEVARALSAGKLSEREARIFSATGGDEYELCFSAPAVQSARIRRLADDLNLPLTCIGKIRHADSAHVLWTDAHAKPLDADLLEELAQSGFDHFRHNP